MKCNIYDLGAGQTPMIQLPPDENGNVLFLKMESQNPIGHSAKARSAAQMLLDYDGDLKGKTIIESSSGNTVLALAEFGDALGFKVVAVVDDSLPSVKKKHLIDKGVELEFVAVPAGCDSRTLRKERVRQLSEKIGCIWLNQYGNPACPKAHLTTASEILEETNGQLDYLIGAIGTGGTIVGTSHGIKDKCPNVKTIAIEPQGSTIFGEAAAPFKNFGAGNDRSVFWERDVDSIDAHMSVPDTTTINNALAFYSQTGIPIGLSAAMAYEAVKRLFRFNYEKKAVLIVPDSLENYFDLSTLIA